jgi:cytochrome c oxidase subunit 2
MDRPSPITRKIPARRAAARRFAAPAAAARCTAFAAFAALAARPATAEYRLNLPAPASGIAQDIYDLHTLVLWICAVIFVVVFVPMGIALWRHRKSAGHAAHPFHDNFRLEVVWTIVPVLILVGMAWPATKTVLAMKDTSAADLTIKVTGSQWKWEYEYLGDGIRFLSALSTPQAQIDNAQAKTAHYLLEVDRPLVVPTGKKVRLVLVASDVIHAWWVPALGVKQDAVPGFVREAWFRVDAAGSYRGQCAELCGTGHAFMPIVVEAVPPERFAAWKDEQKALAAAEAAAAGKTFELSELLARGEQVYLANCAACHQASGAGVPGAFPKLDGSPLVRGPLADHLAIVMNGKPGTAMAAFGKQLSDLDLAAVVSYERNAWSNRSGEPVQPAQVAAARRREAQ